MVLSAVFLPHTVRQPTGPIHDSCREKWYRAAGKGGPGPNSYRVRVTPRGGGGIGDSPKFGCDCCAHVSLTPSSLSRLVLSFGTREQNVRPEDAVDRVAYIGKPYERENYGGKKLCRHLANFRTVTHCGGLQCFRQDLLRTRHVRTCCRRYMLQRRQNSRCDLT